MNHSRPFIATVRIVVIDDSIRVRSQVRDLLAGEPGVEVVGDAGSAAAGIGLVERRAPDVVLLDLDMPRRSGLDALPDLQAAAPGARIVALTVSHRREDVQGALLGGAAGYVVKGASARSLRNAIVTAARGETPLSPRVAGHVVAGLRASALPAAPDVPLSERELAVLRLLAQGKENGEIADELIISPNTVRRHVQAILGKLGISNRTQAAVYAVRERLI